MAGSRTVDEATASATTWLAKFAKLLIAGNSADAANMFAVECYWRDLLSFTWNIKTMEGHLAIVAMLDSQLAAIEPKSFALEGKAKRVDGTIEAWFVFETGRARGRGHLRLERGRCFTLLTTMTELIGHEEPIGVRRATGIEHRANHNRQSWLEQRQQEEMQLGHLHQPWCLVIGGGQGGIMLGARLRQLGVATIIIEKNARAGDSWRRRYHSLVLHDPVWYDHLPYIPFPENWPVFTPKDKMGDWLEMYARVMELNYWSSTECISAAYDKEAAEWRVTVRRDGREIVLRPKHLVFATGSYGPPSEIKIMGAERFSGTQYHSSKHQTAAPWRGKKAIVVGASSSAHDICADLWENEAASITMIQRSATTVVSSETLMQVAFADLYSQEAVQSGMTTEMADLVFASQPSD